MRPNPFFPAGFGSLRPPDAHPRAIEPALEDLERALCRDRCHAVVEARAGEERRSLLRTLTDRLVARSFPVAQLRGDVPGAELCARILTALGKDSEGDAEVQLLGIVSELGAQHSALVLLIDDADELPEAALRHLGRLASASRPDLRLALVVTARPGGSSMLDVIAALGVGAEKVQLAPRVNRGPRPVRVETPPPRELPSETFETLPALSSSRRSLPAGGVSLVVGALALLGVAWLAGSDAESVAPAPQPVAAAPVVPEPLVVSAAPAPVEAMPPVPEPVVEPEPPVEPKPAVEPEPRVEPAPGPRPIRVSLNSRPWARIQIDGREVGITPLANLPLSPGPHRFRAELADGRVVEKTLTIDAFRDRVIFP